MLSVIMVMYHDLWLSVRIGHLEVRHFTSLHFYRDIQPELLLFDRQVIHHHS